MLELARNSSCGNARYYRARRDILGDDGSGSDQRSLANGHARENRRIAADRGSRFYVRVDPLPVVAGLQASVGVDRARIAIVDKHYAMADKHTVVDVDAGANKAMAGNLAV